jgi:hypothetical protein
MTFDEFSKAAEAVVADRLPGARMQVRQDGSKGGHIWYVDIWPKKTSRDGWGLAFDPEHYGPLCVEHGREHIANGLERVMRERARRALS